MPIGPENMARYPGGSIRSPEWLAIRAAILRRAQSVGWFDKGRVYHQCECIGECGVWHYEEGFLAADGPGDAADLIGNNWHRCQAANREPHPITGSRVVLTIAHIDQDPANNEPANLRALCQRCHNALDAPWRRRNAHATRHRRKASGDLFDGPYDAGAAP